MPETFLQAERLGQFPARACQSYERLLPQSRLHPICGSTPGDRSDPVRFPVPYHRICPRPRAPALRPTVSDGFPDGIAPSGPHLQLTSIWRPSYDSPFFLLERFKQIIKFPVHFDMPVAENKDLLYSRIHTALKASSSLSKADRYPSISRLAPFFCSKSFWHSC